MIVLDEDSRSLYQGMIATLELSASDLAELGGISESHARRIMDGSCIAPNELCTAVKELDDDVIDILEFLRKEVEWNYIDGVFPSVIFLFSSNEDLRRHFPTWPGRGHASGGFATTYNAGVEFLRAQMAREDYCFAEVRYGPEHRGVKPVLTSWNAIRLGMTDEEYAEFLARVDAMPRDVLDYFVGDVEPGGSEEIAEAERLAG